MPLPLQTLRVLGQEASGAIVPELLKSLLNLRCLQLSGVGGDINKEQLVGALQQASQLEELHLPPSFHAWEGLGDAVAAALPRRMKHLSWRSDHSYELLDLSHLTHLSSLELLGFCGSSVTANKLPAGLKELDVAQVVSPAEVLLEQPQLVTAAHLDDDSASSISTCTNLRAMVAYVRHLVGNGVAAQLTSLSALTVHVGCVYGEWTATRAQALSCSLAKVKGLRRLSIDLNNTMIPMPGMACMTGLTRLAVHADDRNEYGSFEDKQGWVSQLGQLPSLKRLSVPDALLALPDQSWMGNLQQLLVLEVVVFNKHPHVVDMSGSYGAYVVKQPNPHAGEECECRMQQVLGNLCAVPPKLQLLMVTGLNALQAASLQLRRRLQQQMMSCSSCEVVVTPCDPTLRLAGLPEVLQQALA
jgi:hypothetical protein